MSETPIKFIELSDMPAGYWKTKKGLIAIKNMSKGHIQNALRSISQTFKLNRQRYDKSLYWQRLSRYRILTDEEYLRVIKQNRAKRDELLKELRSRK